MKPQRVLGFARANIDKNPETDIQCDQENMSAREKIFNFYPRKVGYMKKKYLFCDVKLTSIL
jgi:hypothetical protein